MRLGRGPEVAFPAERGRACGQNGRFPEKLPTAVAVDKLHLPCTLLVRMNSFLDTSVVIESSLFSAASSRTWAGAPGKKNPTPRSFMAEAIKIGIAGARFAARFHCEGYRRVYGVPVKVVGVTSKSAESREAFARERGVKSFASFDELCEAVDVVDLCTPGSTHEPLAV